jgi:subtilisin family serine protease
MSEQANETGKQELLPPGVQILGLPGSPASPLSPGLALIRQLYDPETGRYRRFHYGLPGGLQEQGGVSGYTGKGQRCALIDSGILRNHPDLAGHVVDEIDFTGEGPEDKFGHGTMVALDLIHKAPDAKIVSVKAIDASGRGHVGRLLRAMAWVRKRADVTIVNMSLGIFRPQCTGHCSVCQAAGRMVDAGKIVLVAVGNTEGLEACPAKNHEKVISVVDINPLTDAVGDGLFGPDTLAAPFPIVRTEWV